MFDIDPSYIAESIYMKEGNFGDAGGFNAGYMSVDDRMRIVCECIVEFERQFP